MTWFSVSWQTVPGKQGSIIYRLLVLFPDSNPGTTSRGRAWTHTQEVASRARLTYICIIKMVTAKAKATEGLFKGIQDECLRWVRELSLIFSFSLFHSIVNFVLKQIYLLQNCIQKLVKVRDDLLAFIFNQQVFKEICFTGIEHWMCSASKTVYQTDYFARLCVVFSKFSMNYQLGGMIIIKCWFIFFIA